MENTQIFFEGIYAKIYAKIVQSSFLCSRLLKQQNKSKIQWPEVYLNKDLVGKGKIKHSGRCLRHYV